MISKTTRRFREAYGRLPEHVRRRTREAYRRFKRDPSHPSPRFKAGSRLMATKRRKKRFLICVRNEGCDDLELRKLYEQLPDARAAQDGYVRIIDESGEDYLYPAHYFVAVELPREAARAVGAASR